MALDTRNNRASALACGLAALAILPAPDGTVDQVDRQQAGAVYAGIVAGTAVVGPVDIVDLMMTFRRTVTVEASTRRQVDLTVER
jgi:hypothetical protein